jgi:hypothetical protein
MQRLLASVLMAFVAVTGVAVALAWSPASTGLITPAAAQEDDDDDDDGGGDDDDDGSAQVPAGGVATGLGGTATPTGDDDDNGDDDDSAQVPAGGVATGLGGTAESWTAEPTGSTESDGNDSLAQLAAPTAALALGGLAAARLARARLGGRQG